MKTTMADAFRTLIIAEKALDEAPDESNDAFLQANYEAAYAAAAEAEIVFPEDFNAAGAFCSHHQGAGAVADVRARMADVVVADRMRVFAS